MCVVGVFTNHNRIHTKICFTGVSVTLTHLVHLNIIGYLDMNRFALLLIPGLLAANCAFPQKSYLGYNGGIGFSNLRSTQIYEDNGSTKMAYLVNGVYQKYINQFLDVNTGVQLQLKGDVFNNFTAITPKDTGDFEMLGFRLGYLTIPVTAQFHTQGKRIRPYFAGGITGSMLLYNKATVAEYTPCFIYYDTKFDRVEFGVTSSIGFEYQYIKRSKMTVEIQGNWGVSNSVASGPMPFYNRSFLLVVGHRHRLRK